MNIARLASRLAGAAALAMLAAGPGVAQTPQRGGTIIFSIAAEGPTFDCHGTDSATVIYVAAPFYSTLLKFDLDNYPKLKGDLAESWSVSSDGLSYSFKLRPNVVFHDGTPLTSADIKATYERIRKPPQGVVSVRSDYFAGVDTIETPDPLTVVFRLKEADPGLLNHFASPWNCVYSAARLAENPNYPVTNIMGTGAFKFGEYVKGSHFTGTRFDRYFIAGQPYLDGLRGVFITGAPMVNALQGGQIHIDTRGVSPAQRDRLVQAMGKDARVVEGNTLINFILTFNTEKLPFNDIRVRQALNLAIDRWTAGPALQRQSLLQEAGGVLRPGAELASPPAELEKLPGFGRDVNAARAEARRLLREAGVPNLTFALTNRSIPDPYTPAGVYLVDQWRQIGVTVEHKQLEPTAYLQSIGSGNFDVVLDFQTLFMDDPTLNMVKFLSSDRTAQSRWRGIDRELDTLFDRQRKTADLAQRRTLIQAFERRVFEQANAVPFMWWGRIVVMNAAVQNWKFSPTYLIGEDYTDVWLAR